MAQTAIIGTELKFDLYFEPIGTVHAAYYDFSIKAYCNSRSNLAISKAECVKTSQDNYLVMVDTTTLGIGQLTFEVTAYIPDGNFEDGLRTEIVRYITDVEVIL